MALALDQFFPFQSIFMYSIIQEAAYETVWISFLNTWVKQENSYGIRMAKKNNQILVPFAMYIDHNISMTLPPNLIRHYYRGMD